MRTRKINAPLAIVCGVLMLCAAGTTTADQGREEAKKTEKTGQTAMEYKLSPDGWVTIGVDYDNDGSYDAFETVYYYDLVRAQKSSQQRAQQEGRTGAESQQGMMGDQRSQQRLTDDRWSQEKKTKDQWSQERKTGEERFDRQARARDRQHDSLTGEITELRKIDLAGTDEQFLAARIETDRGQTAKVMLGSSSELARLDLERGDTVTVMGNRGHINDKSMLIASTVRSGDTSVAVDMPSTRHAKRVRGEIQSTRTANFRGFGEPFMLAEVELVSGRTETVNLGPQSKVQQLDLQQGDDIKLLVRPGRISGESAMIAEAIYANEKLVDLPRPEESRRFQSGAR